MNTPKDTGQQLNICLACYSVWVWPHLYGIVQGRASRMQRQVLEGFDLRSFPTALLGPVNGQHVIRKLLSKNQAGRLGLRLACRAAFKDQIGRLR